MPRTVWVLTIFASLVMTGAPFIVLAGGILGHQLAPSNSLATLPIALFVVGAAIAVYPVVRLMGRAGRKVVLIGACLLVAAGGALGATGVYLAQFWILCGASCLLGVAQAAFAQVRFAAAEIVPVDQAGQATARIMLSGLAAAIIGPELSTSGLWLAPQPFLGGFILLACLALLALALLVFHYQNYYPPVIQASGVTPRVRYWRSPLVVMSITSAALAYGMMSLIMTATPVNMHVHHQFGLDETKRIIQAHIFAMFLPSFFSGWLINRFGEGNLILVGLGCYAVTIAVALSGVSVNHFGVALVLLGFGWNFMFVAATASLVKASTGADPYRMQAINDLCVVTCQAFAALGAGWLLDLWGWHVILWGCAPLVVACAGLVLWAKAGSLRRI